ncbi:MAG: phosphoglycerate dehydrogenase [Chloroflexi bacterium]|nr:phosphoglycerate dehydrogenase [Chloroflexota bacterium]
MRVLVADPIAREGIELLTEAGAQVDVKSGMPPGELETSIAEYDALIVRSGTQVTASVLEAARRLQVVGRAGVGVDNIDVEAATRHGILVVNAPTSNIVAAAEHSFALMLALARHVPQANAALKAGRWARQEFMGTELRGKLLGIFGLGKVGSAVARRAKAFEMRVVACDPFVSEEHARALGVELMSKEDLLREADFISIHVPMTASTRDLIGPKELAQVKPSVRIVNTARGGLVDEQALYEAVEEGRVAGAAVDTFAVEPAVDSLLFRSDKIIVTPHLGASTEEAQTMVAVEVAQQVLEVLHDRPAQFAVNAPSLLPEALAVLAPFVAVARLIGKVATQLAEGQFQSVVVTYAGEIAQHDTTILKSAIIGGLLAPVSDERVNVVNADLIAAQRGMQIQDQKVEAQEAYRNVLTVELETSAGVTCVSGTSILGQSHIIRIDEFSLDIRAGDGYLLLIENQDRPGMIGAVGAIAGGADVNISNMEVGRVDRRKQAIMALSLDEPMPDSALQSIREIPGIIMARQVQV